MPFGSYAPLILMAKSDTGPLYGSEHAGEVGRTYPRGLATVRRNMGHFGVTAVLPVEFEQTVSQLMGR